MGERFTLDVDSFQRLLAAAWVLQCERDRKNTRISREASVVCLGRKVNRVPENFPIPSYIFEAETRPNQSQALNGSTGSDVEASPSQVLPAPLQVQSSAMAESGVWRPKPAASVPLPADVSGALALAPERHETAESNVIPFLLAELQQESVWEKIERAAGGRARRIAGTVVEWRDRLQSELRVKVIIRGRTMDRLARYAAPVFALLILGALLIPQVSSRVGWLRSVRAAVHLPGSVGAGGSGPVLETSHLRVTDAAELALLNQMSRYEVRSMRRQAEFGDDSVALTLGMAYETGRGVPQNCQEAARWMELAAEDGNAAAEYNLALRYLSGDGVVEDRGVAKKWLEAASRQGYEKARVILQSMNS